MWPVFVETISPQELYKRLQGGDELFLLDIRTPEEYNICHIDKSVLMPLEEVQKRYEELPRNKDIVVVSHHGTQAEVVVSFLRCRGFRAFNLKGGIHLWSITIAHDMILY